MPTTTGGESRDARGRFGDALSDAMKVRGYSQRDLGQELGVSQPAVSGWVVGDAEPAATTVFAAEKVLGLTPGTLSRHLGYLPTDAVKSTPTFEAVVSSDPLLEEHDKRGLLALYREVTRRSSSRGGRPRAGS